MAGISIHLQQQTLMLGDKVAIVISNGIATLPILVGQTTVGAGGSQMV